MYKPFGIYVALTLTATNLFAEGLPPVVVTASHFAIPGDLSSSTVSTLTRQEIQSLSPIDLTELLRNIAGVHVDRVGGSGGFGSVYIRGADPNAALVLLNGIPVNDPLDTRGGTFDFSTIDISEVQKIEIVKGSYSAIYGSDALSGVINIITVTDENSGGKLSFNFGTESFLNNSFTVSYFGNGVNSNLGASFYSDTGGIEGNDVFRGSVHFNLRKRYANGINAEFYARYNTNASESFPEGSGGPLYAEIREVDHSNTTQQIYGGAVSKSIFPWLYSMVEYGFFLKDAERESPGVASGLRDPFGIPKNYSDDLFLRHNISVKNKIFFNDLFSAVVGANGRFEDGQSKGALKIEDQYLNTDFSLYRSTLAPFIELEATPIESLIINSALRLDDVKDQADQKTARAGFRWKIPEVGSTLHAKWSEGFKLPSFYALGNPIVGDNALSPEESETYEAGIEYEPFRNFGKISLVGFRSEYINLIDLVDGPPPTLVNRNRVEVNGLEGEAKFDFTDEFSLRAHASYLNTDIKDTNEKLRNRPSLRTGATLTWKLLNKLTFNLTAIYVDEVLDSAIPTGEQKLNDYLRFNSNIQWESNDKIRFLLTADNLLDEEYQEYIGFPGEGLRVRFGTIITL